MKQEGAAEKAAFLDDLRKQFLMWRSLSDSDREVYVAQLDQWLESQPAAGG